MPILHRLILLGMTMLAGIVMADEPQPKVGVAWLREIQTAPAVLPADAPQLSSLLVNGTGEPIVNAEQWIARRKELETMWREKLGTLPHPIDRTPDIRIELSEEVGGVSRKLISYEVEPGVRTEAYVLRPLVAKGPLPGVAVFHSTVAHSIRQPAGIEGPPEKFFGLRLAQRGCITICPRNFLWPDNHAIDAQGETRRFQERQPNVSGMAKMLYDSIVAVNILLAQPDIDSQRIGAVGHSLGAKEVLYLAAFDPRIRATVSSEGGIGIRFSNWEAPWYLGEQVKDASFQREHHELLGMIAPRPFLLLGGDSADGDRGWPFINKGLEVYRLLAGPDASLPCGMFNHKQGHAVPPLAEQRIYEWFDHYLLGK